MSAVRRRIAVIITFFAAMLAMPALTTSAHAAAGDPGYGGVLGLTISANAVGQGCSVTLSGSNFFGAVTISGAVTSSATADESGNFTKAVDTSQLSQGSQTVTVSDNLGDTATVSFTVVSKVSDCSVNNGTGAVAAGGGGTNNGGTGGLSNTGVAVIGIGTVGGILLAGGALMLVAGRRRQVSI